MATQDELKQQVAKAAVEYVKGGIIGVGTGSTANFFIDELAKVKSKIDAKLNLLHPLSHSFEQKSFQEISIGDLELL